MSHRQQQQSAVQHAVRQALSPVSSLRRSSTTYTAGTGELSQSERGARTPAASNQPCLPAPAPSCHRSSPRAGRVPGWEALLPAADARHGLDTSSWCRSARTRLLLCHVQLLNQKTGSAWTAPAPSEPPPRSASASLPAPLPSGSPSPSAGCHTQNCSSFLPSSFLGSVCCDPGRQPVLSVAWLLAGRGLGRRQLMPSCHSVLCAQKSVFTPSFLQFSQEKWVEDDVRCTGHCPAPLPILPSKVPQLPGSIRSQRVVTFPCSRTVGVEAHLFSRQPQKEVAACCSAVTGCAGAGEVPHALLPQELLAPPALAEPEQAPPSGSRRGPGGNLAPTHSPGCCGLWGSGRRGGGGCTTPSPQPAARASSTAPPARSAEQGQ